MHIKVNVTVIKVMFDLLSYGYSTLHLEFKFIVAGIIQHYRNLCCCCYFVFLCIARICSNN